MKNIISQDWLMNNIDRNDLLIFDARSELSDPDYGLREYEKEHIQNAQYISVEDVLTGKIDIHGGRHPLPKLDKFVEDMKQFGVHNDSTIVIYDDGDLTMAGRMWWLLKYIGVEQVYVLEGGMKLWKENGRSTTTEVPNVKKSDSLSMNLNSSMEVDIDYVKRTKDSEKVALIDSRAAERYRGEVEPIDKIPGHIPNAINYPWMDVLDGVNVKSKEELEKRFESLKNYDEIIVYCGSGITGTVNYIFMEEVGLKPKLYVGGYSDWISYDDNDIAKE